MQKVVKVSVFLCLLCPAGPKATHDDVLSQGTFGPYRPALPAITPDVLATINRIRGHHLRQYETTISEEAALILRERSFFMLPAPVPG